MLSQLHNAEKRLTSLTKSKDPYLLGKNRGTRKWSNFEKTMPILLRLSGLVPYSFIILTGTNWGRKNSKHLNNQVYFMTHKHWTRKKVVENHEAKFRISEVYWVASKLTRKAVTGTARERAIKQTVTSLCQLLQK